MSLHKPATFDQPPATRFGPVLGGVLLVALVFAVYAPILPGSFLMDDTRLIGRDNALVNGSLTLRSLWFQTDFTLATFGWWLEQLAFGSHPGGYHVVNLALQSASGILLWRLLLQLKVPGAWLAAAAFAVHPVAVCTVARVAELKNTLSLPFFLLSLIGYLRYEALELYPGEQLAAGEKPLRCRSATLWLALSLVCFVLALLAKTTAVVLPVILLLCALWRRRRLSARDGWHLSPYFVLALGFGLMSVWFQRHQALTTTHLTLPPSSLRYRLANAGFVAWFYLGKALWPLNLNIVYPPWKVDPANVSAFLPDALAVAVLAFCGWFHRSWGRPALFGLGCFAVALFPALGFFDAQFMTLWQVSDHLQYLALPAIIALASGALAHWLKPTAFRVAAALLLLVLATLGFQRASVFRSPESLLRDSLAKNPAAWESHNDLGVILARRGNYAGAIQEFQQALQANPASQEARQDLAQTYLVQGKLADAAYEMGEALKLNPGDASLQQGDAEILRAMGRNQEALEQFLIANALKPDPATFLALASMANQSGDKSGAVKNLRQALALNPDSVEALNNLAWILATSKVDSLRNGREAVRDAQRACELTRYQRASLLGVLAAAYAEAGDFPQAIARAEQACQLANQAGDSRWVAISNQFLTAFQAGKPWRE